MSGVNPGKSLSELLADGGYVPLQESTGETDEEINRNLARVEREISERLKKAGLQRHEPIPPGPYRDLLFSIPGAREMFECIRGDALKRFDVPGPQPE